MMRLLLAVTLLLASCGSLVTNRTEHRWIGPLTAANPTPLCPPTKGVLLLRDGNVTFAPDQGTWVLDGKATPTTLAAARSRPTSDHKLYQTDLRAEWNDTSVHGTYTTPQCTYRVDLSSY